MERLVVLLAACVLAGTAFADNPAGTNGQKSAVHRSGNKQGGSAGKAAPGRVAPGTFNIIGHGGKSKNPCNGPNPPHDCRQPRPPH